MESAFGNSLIEATWKDMELCHKGNGKNNGFVGVLVVMWWRMC